MVQSGLIVSWSACPLPCPLTHLLVQVHMGTHMWNCAPTRKDRRLFTSGSLVPIASSPVILPVLQQNNPVTTSKLGIQCSPVTSTQTLFPWPGTWRLMIVLEFTERTEREVCVCGGLRCYFRWTTEQRAYGFSLSHHETQKKELLMFCSMIKIAKDLFQIKDHFSMGWFNFLFPMKSHENFDSKQKNIWVHLGP